MAAAANEPPKSRDALQFSELDRVPLEPYMPPRAYDTKDENSIFSTLTFATSLDSALSIAPGVQTALSGPQSKAMTHYLRSRHDAILIGAGTAIADNPSLNCRIEGVGGYGGQGLEGQPRPIVVDPDAKWKFSKTTKIMALAAEGRGKAPYIITMQEPDEGQSALLASLGGRYLHRDGLRRTGQGDKKRMDWRHILELVRDTGHRSVMIEGGGGVINDLLQPRYVHLINSVIVTIAPTWLGEGGVTVSPPRRTSREGTAVPAARLRDVKWMPLGEDVVLCGRLND